MGKINKTGRVGTTNKTRRYMWVVNGVYVCTAIGMHNVVVCPRVSISGKA